MSSTCIIATFGDAEEWNTIAERALLSVARQTEPFDDVIRVHGCSLQAARNEGADLAASEWLVFLDADDELDPGYNEAMLAGEGDIRRPATLGIVNGVEDDAPVMIPRTDMRYTNCVVIGAMVRREDFLAVGGFLHYDILEDWDLWIRLLVNGAKIGDVPEAIYRVHVSDGGRNSNQNLHSRVYNEIRAKASGLLNCYVGGSDS